MFTIKERILVSLVGFAAVALGFALLFLPFFMWETYGWSWEFVAAGGMWIFIVSAITAGS